ncbi:MAG: hypothetical protein BroJett040_12830 [Oligoflexia bacterium]|nr:MAG: hypothetical protein BroJett040_12830 [Oligoflexia bacterium]
MRNVYLLILFFSLGAHAAETNFYQDQIQPTLEKSSDEIGVKLWLGGVASVLVARHYDDQVREQWRLNQKMSRSETRSFNDYIDNGVNFGIALTQYFVDRENGISHLRALGFTAVTTTAMKKAFRRERPNQSNHDSFPSGHTSSAFATATSLTHAYGWRAAVIFYPLSVGVGLSRISSDDHWFSDVVGGAFLGFIWGRAGYFHSTSNSAVVPWIEGDAGGLIWTARY